MNWEDTLNNTTEERQSVDESIEALLRRQAEISFKAGEKLSLEKQGQTYLEGKQSGIKEVVDWMREQGYMIPEQIDDNSPIGLKLKEWGIDNEQISTRV